MSYGEVTLEDEFRLKDTLVLKADEYLYLEMKIDDLDSVKATKDREETVEVVSKTEAFGSIKLNE